MWCTGFSNEMNREGNSWTWHMSQRYCLPMGRWHKSFSARQLICLFLYNYTTWKRALCCTALRRMCTSVRLASFIMGHGRHCSLCSLLITHADRCHQPNALIAHLFSALVRHRHFTRRITHTPTTGVISPLLALLTHSVLLALSITCN